LEVGGCLGLGFEAALGLLAFADFFLDFFALIKSWQHHFAIRAVSEAVSIERPASAPGG
jgi:hypothetical protein|tara:strand:- start:3466 stop:3642 length:177 start_codon:yes stop_codon:yes gene_type:complete